MHASIRRVSPIVSSCPPLALSHRTATGGWLLAAGGLQALCKRQREQRRVGDDVMVRSGSGSAGGRGRCRSLAGWWALSLVLVQRRGWRIDARPTSAHNPPSTVSAHRGNGGQSGPANDCRRHRAPDAPGLLKVWTAHLARPRPNYLPLPRPRLAMRSSPAVQSPSRRCQTLRPMFPLGLLSLLSLRPPRDVTRSSPLSSLAPFGPLVATLGVVNREPHHHTANTLLTAARHTTHDTRHTLHTTPPCFCCSC